MTGLGLKISILIVSISGGNLLLALTFTMITVLILGMGLPTAASYILVADAYDAKGDFKDYKPKRVLGVMSVSSQVYNIVVKEDSPIN